LLQVQRNATPLDRASASIVLGSRIAHRFGELGVPSDHATQSVTAALKVVAGLPENVAGPALEATGEPFMAAVHTGSLAAVGATVFAAVVIVIFLPRRNRESR
jgi:hypothetical protein